MLILCSNLLSYPKIRLDFPMKCSFSCYVYMEKFIDPAFPATTKIYFCLLTFYFSFFILSYFVNLTSLMPSHTEQCFYYKNYTSLLKKAFNIQISITNSFKNLKAKRQSNWISDNYITWLQNFDVAFVTKLLQKITMLSVVIAVTYGYI